MASGTIMYLCPRRGKPRKLAIAISDRFPHHSYRYSDQVEEPYDFSVDTKAVIIVGRPESTIRPKYNYFNFLRAAETVGVKVFGVLTESDKRDCFPNKNEGLTKMLNSREMNVTEIVDEIILSMKEKI